MTIVDGKIWAPFETFYINAMLFNCQSAIQSLVRISTALEKLPQNATEEDILNLPGHAILNELQNVVIQGGALSRYFWPVRKGHEERGHQLRQALAVGDDSPLHDRNLRNAIEHFDEKLDAYLSSGLVGYIFPEFVAPRPREDGMQGHFFRAYFIDCGVFRLLDGEYEIEPLALEIQRISAALEEADENCSRLPSGANNSVERNRPQAALVGSLRGFSAAAAPHVKR